MLGSMHNTASGTKHSLLGAQPPHTAPQLISITSQTCQTRAAQAAAAHLRDGHAVWLEEALRAV